MPRQLRTAATAATVLVLGQALAPAVAADQDSSAAARATCHGKRATIVGNDRDNRLVGTRQRDVIVARGGADKIFGRGARDVICAGPGRDLLDGGAGNDYLSGGDRLDRVSYKSAARGVTVKLHRNVATGQGRDRILGIENVLGSRHRDTLYGAAPRNALYGRGGNDLIFGGAGNDLLEGGPGADGLWDTRGANALRGGDGTDSMRILPNEGDRAAGQAGHDSIEFATDAGVSVDLSIDAISYPVYATVVSVQTVFGTNGPDALYGSVWDETFRAGDGDDWVDAGLGTDWVDAGLGNDGCVNAETAYSCEF